MAEMTPELRAAIDTAKERIKVDSYYTKVMNGGWKGRSQGFWAGTGIGVFGGLIVGAIASLAIVAAPVALAGVAGFAGWPLILGFAGVGAGVGGAGGALIGSPAGAVSAGLAERERRDRAEKLEHEVLQSTDKQREVIDAYRKDPVIERTDTLAEIKATSKTGGEFWHKVIDWKSILLTGAIGAVIGVIVCTAAVALAVGGGAVPAAGVALGYGTIHMAGYGSAALLGAGLGFGTGGLFGGNFPSIFGNLVHRSSDILSWRVARGEPSQYQHIKTAAEMQQEATQNREAMVSPQIMAVGNVQAASEVPLTQVRDMVAMDKVQQADMQPQLSA